MYFLTPMCTICLKCKNDTDYVNMETLSKLFYCMEKTEEFISPISDRMKICKSCLAQLNVAVRFKKMCLNNIVQFRNYIDQLEQACNNCKAFNVIKIELYNIKYQSEFTQLLLDKHIKNVFIKNEIFNTSEEEVSKDDGIESLPEKVFDLIASNEECDKKELQNIKDERTEFNQITVKNEIYIETYNNSEFEKHSKSLINKEEIVDDICEEELRDNSEKIIKFTEFQNLGSNKQGHENNLTSMLSHTEENPCSQFPCPPCGKSFLDKSATHTQIETVLRLHLCSVCGKGFKRKSNLNEHMFTHNNLRPFSCTVCGNGFIRKIYLDQHMEMHNNQRPYSCTTCGIRFKRENNLSKHMLRHSDQQPYSCSICGNVFKRKHDLNRHMLIHSNQQPYACSMCGRKFNRKSSLRRHSTVCFSN